MKWKKVMQQWNVATVCNQVEKITREHFSARVVSLYKITPDYSFLVEAKNELLFRKQLDVL